MLQVSKIIFYNVDVGKFEVMDKLLTTTEYQFDLTTETLLDWVYDYKRRLLWVLTQTALYRVRLDFNSGTGAINSHTIEATITNVTININYNLGKRLDIHWKTGACFYIYRDYTPSHVITVYKIAVDASTATSLSVPTETGLAANVSNRLVNMCIDQSSGKVVCLFYLNITSPSSNLSAHARWGILVNNDLSGHYDVLNFGSLMDNSGTTMSIVFPSFSTTYFSYSRQESNYDATTGLIRFSGAGSQTVTHLLKVIGNKTFVEYEDRPSYYWQSTVGYKTGNRYTWSDLTLKCIDRNGVELFNINYPFTNWGFIFNPYTEEFYRVNTTTKTLYAYDRWTRQIGVRAAAFTTNPSYFLPLPGGENAVSIGISPNIVIFPNANQRTSDTTPTVVFKVGISPAGWTQQFTTVMDRTFSVVDGGTVSGTYERIASSWLGSTDYKDWTWEYSTDYSETTLSGTWSALGTGTPLQTGGAMPTNGVISDSDQSVYARFTVSNDDILTGAETEDIWYMKIFSHST